MIEREKEIYREKETEKEIEAVRHSEKRER